MLYGKCKSCLILKQVVPDDNLDNINAMQKPLDIPSMFTTLLDKIVTSLSAENLDATLSALKKIFNNIIQHPNDEKYRQIKLADKTFSSKVCMEVPCL